MEENDNYRSKNEPISTFLPSFRFTLAAVILIKPGGVILLKVTKPRNKEVIKFI
jgi:hypothetical protein